MAGRPLLARIPVARGEAGNFGALHAGRNDACLRINLPLPVGGAAAHAGASSTSRSDRGSAELAGIHVLDTSQAEPRRELPMEVIRLILEDTDDSCFV